MRKGVLNVSEKVAVSFHNQLSLSQAEYVVAKLWYSVEGVLNCGINPASGAFEIETMESAKDDAIRTTKALIDEARTVNPTESRPLRRSAAAPPETLATLTPWDSGFKEEEARLLATLDRSVWEIAESFGARLRQYPSTIPYEVMERSNYLWEFPQDIFLVYECPHDAAALQTAKTRRSFSDIVRPTAAMMAPAICYHCYAEYRGQRLSNPMVLTAGGKCFRHESPARLGVWRLSEFHMREIVFMGPPGFVHDTRQALIEAVWNWFSELGLVGKVETASDPFYFAGDYVKQHHQLREGAKYELSAALSNDRFVAVASFNDLGRDLCEPFDITDPSGNIAHSGCVGVGMERMARALFAYHGPVVAKWPNAVREALVSRGSMMMHG